MNIDFNALYKQMENARKEMNKNNRKKKSPSPSIPNVNRGWNEGFNLEVNAFNRAVLVQETDKYTGFVKYLEQQDEESSKFGVRFANEIPKMLEIYQHVLDKQKRVKSMDVAAASILGWVKQKATLDEDHVFQLTQEKIRFKKHFDAKLIELHAEGKIAYRRIVPADFETHIRTIRKVLPRATIPEDLYAQLDKKASAIAELYSRFLQGNAWAKRIVGAPEQRLTVFLLFVIHHFEKHAKPEEHDILFTMPNMVFALDKKGAFILQEFLGKAKPFPFV